MGAIHVFAENFDLSFHDAPELVFVQVVVTFIIDSFGAVSILGCRFGAVACDFKERGNECFLHIGKREAVGDICNGGAEELGEWNRPFCFGKLVAPEGSIEGAFVLMEMVSRSDISDFK